MQDMQDMIDRLNQSGKRLSKGHRKIAQYIVEHYDKAVFMTASRLGESVGVSDSTVVRFAAAMGYEGYPQLQRSLQELVSHRLRANQRFEMATELDPSAALTTVLKSDMQNLRNTLEQVEQQVFDEVVQRLLNANDIGQADARKKQAAELKKAEKRKAEVDTLFARMYEDWAAGRITEYNFSMLSGKYQSEQAELEEKIEQLQSAIATESQNAADAEKWIALMKECVNPTELTAELLNTLIEKILVHEAVKGEDGSREQEVEIFYRFIGKID